MPPPNAVRIIDRQKSTLMRLKEITVDGPFGFIVAGSIATHDRHSGSFEQPFRRRLEGSSRSMRDLASYRSATA